MNQIAEAWPPPRARITGVVYLLYFLTAVFAAVATFPPLAAASLMLWLLVMGVNVQRWKQQAGAAWATIPA